MSKSRVDRSTFFGVLLALSGVVTALILDGGSIKQILQPTAALIVIAGTLGAVMIQFPARTLIDAAKSLPVALFDRGSQGADVRTQLLAYCVQARRHGILGLDSHLEEIEDSFLRKALTLAVDGMHIDAMRENMELEMDLLDEREHAVARVLDAAGGFAPTLGIMGAVLGLIQVMQRMENVTEIGKGIAVAFVSTLYGLGLANLFLLPLAGKMKIRMREKQMVREMMVEAVSSIIAGASPRALKEKLDCYVPELPAKAQPIPEFELVAR